MTVLDDSVAPLWPASPLPLERHRTGGDGGAAFERDVRASKTPRWTSRPPRWFHDARGPVLFDDLRRQRWNDPAGDDAVSLSVPAGTRS